MDQQTAENVLLRYAEKLWPPTLAYVAAVVLLPMWHSDAAKDVSSWLKAGVFFGVLCAVFIAIDEVK